MDHVSNSMCIMGPCSPGKADIAILVSILNNHIVPITTFVNMICCTSRAVDRRNSFMVLIAVQSILSFGMAVANIAVSHVNGGDGHGGNALVVAAVYRALAVVTPYVHLITQIQMYRLLITSNKWMELTLYGWTITHTVMNLVFAGSVYAQILVSVFRVSPEVIQGLSYWSNLIPVWVAYYYVFDFVNNLWMTNLLAQEIPLFITHDRSEDGTMDLSMPLYASIGEETTLIDATNDDLDRSTRLHMNDASHHHGMMDVDDDEMEQRGSRDHLVSLYRPINNHPRRRWSPIEREFNKVIFMASFVTSIDVICVPFLTWRCWLLIKIAARQMHVACNMDMLVRSLMCLHDVGASLYYNSVMRTLKAKYARSFSR